MMRALFVAACLVLWPALAVGQSVTSGGATNEVYDSERNSLRFGNVGPFGESGVYELTNIFSYQSTFGLSYRRDIQSITDTGSISLSSGYIQLKTGTTAGATAQVDTVERGQYQPGKGAEAGIAINIQTAPTSDGKAEWGLGDGDNGAFWRYKGSDTLCIVYESSSTENEVCEGSFNGESLSGFDVSSDAAVYVVRFNWYGVGGAEFWLYETDPASNATLNERLVHRFAPDAGVAMENPNLPVFASVDNGTTTTDVTVDVGGRRYDIQGRFKPDTRLSGDYRTGRTVTASGDPLEPLICVRRESPFPASGRQNSVNVYIEGWDVNTDNDLILWFMSVDSLDDLTGESFGTPSQHVDAETAIETDTSATAIANTEMISGPWYRAGGSTGNAQTLGSEKGRRIPLVSTFPTCLVAIAPGGADATVSATVRVTEEW